MQLQSDIQIKEYTVVPHKVSEKELQQKKLALSFAIFQDEIEAAMIDIDHHNVYTSCIYSSLQRKFAHNELLFLLNDFIHRYHLQQKYFKDIYILFSSPHYVLCPTEFYLPEKKNTLLNYAHPLSANDVILTNEFQNIKIIYAIPTSIQHNLLQMFSSAKVYHSATAMMHLFFYHPSLIHSKIWIHIHPNYIEVIAKNHDHTHSAQKKLLCYNIYDTRTTIDILYYILFCMEQLSFDASQTDVYLSGNISLQHSIFQILHKYVHTVQIVHHHPKLHILPVDTSLISHHHFITLNHHLCVSSQEKTKEEK